MRILITTKRAPFEGRGAEQVIWQIGKRFAAAGHRVRFFCPTPEAQSDVPQVDGIDFAFVETHSAATRGMIEFFLRGSRQYPAAYTHFSPDIVYDNPSPFPLHVAHIYGNAIVINKVHAIYRRLAFTCKDHLLVKLGTLLGEESYRLFRNEYFITNSDSTAERLRPLVNTRNNEVVANPIGIDSSEFEYQFSENAMDVLALSKLTPRKGISYLLRAWKTVEQRLPNASLTIAGSGPREEQLHSLARTLRLNRVTFEGFVSETRKHRLLREAGVFVLPTLYEGFGITNLEAMASGCAVVSTDTWGVKDYITHRENGFLVPPQSVNELADAITTVCSTEELRSSLAQAGRETAESYSMTESLDQELEVMESIAAKQHDPIR